MDNGLEISLSSLHETEERGVWMFMIAWQGQWTLAAFIKIDGLWDLNLLCVMAQRGDMVDGQEKEKVQMTREAKSPFSVHYRRSDAAVGSRHL